MISITDLHGTAREYLRAAKLLRTRRIYDASVYLCGYAVEIALKTRICRTLNWTTGFPETPAEFRLKGNLKTHDLEMLLDYTGLQHRIRSASPSGFLADWSVANKWNPEDRYNPRGTKTMTDAKLLRRRWPRSAAAFVSSGFLSVSGHPADGTSWRPPRG